MKTIGERLNTIAKYYNLNSYSEFAKKTGLNHQTVSNYLKGKQKPDAEKLALIKQSFDDIDADWLLTGRGKMLIDNVNIQNLDIESLTRHLFENNEKLMSHPVFREYINSNIDLLELEKKQREIEDKRSQVKEAMLKKINSNKV